MKGILLRRIMEARRRLIVHDFLGILPLYLIGAWTILLACRGVSSIFFLRWDWPFAIALAMGLPLAISLMTACWRWRKSGTVAREIDRRLPVKDRFSTGLQLSDGGRFEALAQKEIALFAEGQRMSALCSLKPPLRTAWIALPLVGLILVEALIAQRSQKREPEIAQARQLVEKAAEAAREQGKNDPALEKIAQDLAEAAKQLSASPEPLREALRSLDDAQQRAAAQGTALGAAETAALADALAKNHPQLSENLRGGQNAEAAAQIASLDPDELARALKEAERHVEKSRLRDMARLRAGQAKTRLLATFSGGNRSNRNQQKFVSMIDDIKNGTAPSKSEGNGEKGEEEKKSAKGQAQAAQNSDADEDQRGSPGSEKDIGQGGELTKTGEPQNSGTANEDFIPGQQDNGPSLVELYRQAGNDDARAQRAYRAAYGATAPAALEAVEQEDIPVGSRILVRRYFEAIRPKE